jgi:hypothetical protein
MGKRFHSGKLGAGWRIASIAGVVPALAACLILAGCNNTQKQHIGDPLMGEYTPKGPNGQPMPAAPTKTGAATPFAPFTPGSTGSPAALANNTSLPGGKPLAIAQPNWALTNMPKGGSPTVVPVPRDNAAKTVVPAGGVAIGVPAGGGPNANPQPSESALIADLEKALKERGAMNLRHGPVPGGVLASCLVPQFSNPANLRYFEATAADAPAALRSLLEQVRKG